MKCKTTIRLLMHVNDVMFLDLTKQKASNINVSFTGRKNKTQTVSFDGSYVTD